MCEKRGLRLAGPIDFVGTCIVVSIEVLVPRSWKFLEIYTSFITAKHISRPTDRNTHSTHLRALCSLGPAHLPACLDPPSAKSQSGYVVDK